MKRTSDKDNVKQNGLDELQQWRILVEVKEFGESGNPVEEGLICFEKKAF